MRLEAEFVSSAFKLADWPRWNRAEVALAGRSNVGKSSLLNALTGHRHLARTSKTPGRTRCLNFFATGEALALVDLPGYGYAKMSKTQAAAIAEFLREYLEQRRNLVALVLLVDSRRGPQEAEAQLAETIRGRNLDLIVVATKCDKLRNTERADARARFERLEMKPLMCSADTGEGIEQLRRRILACGTGARGHSEAQSALR
jgi:GTP-binding protein